ncbi:MAG: M20/M25/M40 family metallo-hydrolase [Planctomycetes bacterium]|nr:M20/M25/M40 family metallo-hydrolase [Planctomycetota bacterium]
MAAIDWESVLAESLDDFRALLRINTTNPPGNEWPAIEFLASRLAREGIEPKLFRSVPGRGNLAARLRGAGRAPPLMLSGHVDVVPAERGRWSRDPFGAEIHDGHLYGRGAVDMKNMVAMALTVFRLLHRLGAPLARDLIFCAVCDEEAGCEYGSAWMVKHHPDEVRAEYCLTEVGGYTLHLLGRRFCPVQVAEKGCCRLAITARGKPGHGSVPRPDAALPRLARAAALLGTRRLPMRVTRSARAFVDGLARGLSWPRSAFVRRLVTPGIGDFLLDHAFPDRDKAAAFSALLRNTANPTMMRAGEKINVVPHEAVLRVDGRILPGVTPEEFMAEVREIIGEGFEVQVTDHAEGREHPHDDPILGVIAHVMARLDPGAIVIPSIVPGYTDSGNWGALGTKCYGFSPIRLGEDDQFMSLFHGDDERIPVEGYRFGVRALFDVVWEMVTMSALPVG